MSDERDTADECFHDRTGSRWDEVNQERSEEAYDAYDLYREHYEQAVKEFTIERLQSYYLAHPDLAVQANRSLLYAQSLKPSFPEAAFVFAAIATELAVKTVLLKPIIFGLVHTEDLASLIADLIVRQTGFDNFHKLLNEVSFRFGGIDFKVFKRTDSAKLLWNEIKEVVSDRNSVVHRGKMSDSKNVDLAFAVAETLLNEIFPRILTKLELHLDASMTICAQTD